MIRLAHLYFTLYKRYCTGRGTDRLYGFKQLLVDSDIAREREKGNVGLECGALVFLGGLLDRGFERGRARLGRNQPERDT